MHKKIINEAIQHTNRRIERYKRNMKKLSKLEFEAREGDYGS